MFSSIWPRLLSDKYGARTQVMRTLWTHQNMMTLGPFAMCYEILYLNCEPGWWTLGSVHKVTKKQLTLRKLDQIVTIPESGASRS